MMSHIPSAQLLAQVSKSALGVRIGRTHPEDGPRRARLLDRDAWTTTSKRERPAAGREALVEDGPGLLACSGAVYQDAERPGPLDQCMVRPQLPQQDR